MIIFHLIAITIAFALDRIVGDPPNWPHPVRWIGSMIGFLEKRLNRGGRRRLKGILMSAAVLAVAAGAAWGLAAAFYAVHPVAGVMAEAMMISSAIAGKSLKEAGLDVLRPLQAGDLQEARTKLSYIVGRDTDSLSEGEIVRGTVETIAENTSDGVTAPLFWALIGGAPLAIMYRAANTCDSMVGYKNEKYGEFGFFSARLDDWLNIVPSRLTGLLMLLSMRPRKTKWTAASRIWRRDAPKHPSPNSGWCEAAAAAVLGIQLGGVNTYKGEVSVRARMGDPEARLTPLHIRDSILLMERTVLLAIILYWIGGGMIELALAWL